MPKDDVILTDQERQIALATGLSFDEYAALKKPSAPTVEALYKEGDRLVSLVSRAEQGLPTQARQELREGYKGQHPMLDEWLLANPLPAGE